MMSKTLTVYKASAGSGKTFTLATEYIRLLVENPQSYRNILAVTFTNKATEEMKMRIISQLYGIWKRLPESENYFNKIQELTNLNPNTISERAGLGLSNLLHNYNYFRVETIDTFFQSVLRNMARELDLTNNLRIGLNDLQVEDLAVDQLIADLSTTDIMLQWILKYIMENISEDRSWNVIHQIKKFGQTIFKDEYKNVSQDLEKKLDQKGFFENYSLQLRELRQTSLERMKEIGESFFDTLEGEGLTADDLSNKNRGVAGFFNKLRNGVFSPDIENTYVAKCLESPGNWSTKSHPQRDLICFLAETTLGDILHYAIEERPRQWKLYKSADLTLQHLNQLRLLGGIERKVHELNEANNRFLLSDTQQLLHSLIDGSDSPFIFEKIGTQLEHVMIDEFQDTSTVQWQNFRVLIDEAMSHEDGSCLIVGDVKQSIYRWRSGDWRLLNDIEQQFNTSQVEVKPLKVNYRSEKNVIDFNNVFFRHALDLEYLAQEENKDGATQLRRAYQDVEQLVPEKKLSKGEVQVTLLPSDSYEGETMSQIADIIANLLSKGISQNEIAILVRTNSYIPLIAEYFMTHMPEVTIISDEAFRLNASPAVLLLVNALRLLACPDDILTKAVVVKLYHCDVLQEEINDNELFLSTCDLDALLPADFNELRSELLSMPLYDLAERLYAIFNIERLSNQAAYIFAFYDQLAKYVDENTADILSFLSEWDVSLYQKTVQGDNDEGVRILSIHKSKGLEFPYVICPFCDWQLEKGNVIWCQPTEQPFSDLPIVPLRYGRQMTGTIYEKDYLLEHLQNTVDNLNLLYVAFTRACNGLYAIGRRSAKSSRSGLIEQCLPLVAKELSQSRLEGLDDEKSIMRFCYGASEFFTREHSETSEPKSINPFLQPSSGVSVDFSYKESQVSFRQSNRSIAFIGEKDDENAKSQRFIQIGSVLHQVFSAIRTADDIEDALQKLQFEGILYDDEISPESIIKMLHKRLENPQIADWFSPRWQLFNECTILSLENGEVHERRPDRVMTDGNQWIVVDFKFGSPKTEYHEQVREYMDLLESMGCKNIKGYLWFVYSNKIEEV